MASLKITGKVTHYASREGVIFNFQKLNEKRSKENGEDSFDFGDNDLAFEIWQRFKGNKVKIIVEKVK